MRRMLLVVGLVLGLAGVGTAQTPPRLLQVNGVVPGAGPGVATLTFGIYAVPEGGTPVWAETLAVEVGPGGAYTAALGGTVEGGVPVALFTGPAARWLGVTPAGSAELPRVLLVSVPYALKAADAETIAGKPLSAFVLAGNTTGVGADGLTYVNPTTLGGPVVAGPVAEPLSSGTVGHLGKFTTTTDLGNSVVFEAGSAVGVNTTVPLAGFHAVATSAPGALFDVYANSLGALPVVYRAARGTPGAPLPLQTDDILGGLAVRGYAPTGWTAGRGQVMFKAAEAWTDTGHGTYLQFTTTPVGSTGWAERMRIDPAGNVGIGTSAPTAKLHVAGDVVVDGNIGAKYQDVAEWVEAAEDLAAGTVVSVAPGMVNGVRAARAAYEVAVAGAVSAQPGLILGEAGPGKARVAQSGRVKVKVDARYGAIRAGDLLVTSPTAGHAMKSQAVKVKGTAFHRPGTILGKALEGLAEGQGEILVLLTLQ